MRALVFWDDPEEAQLIALYLGVDDSNALVTTDEQEFLSAAAGSTWDIVLLPTTDPPDATDSEEGEGAWRRCRQLRELLPDVPVIGACPAREVYRLARFLTAGMRSYVLRDDAGDFLFLLYATLQGTVNAVRAERERTIADRLRREVDSIRRLQESIIPQHLHPPEGYALAGRYDSSEIHVIGGQPVVMAGGDYYNVFPLDENRLVVLLGDASGHGIRACMSIVTMHTLIGMLGTHRSHHTDEFVTRINSHLCDKTFIGEADGFITLLYGVLDTRTHEFVWTSAGHPRPLLQTVNGDVVPQGRPEDSGLPLGIDPDAEYQVQSTTLPSRSRLLVYSDGLEEAAPLSGPPAICFGIPGIARTLASNGTATVGETITALFHDSSAFTLGAGRHDDTSAVLLERLE